MLPCVNCRAGRAAKNAQVAEGLTPEALSLIQDASSQLNLSIRSYYRTIRVAQTIADLEKSKQIEASHVAEALQYRPR